MRKKFDSFFIWVALAMLLWSLLFCAGVVWGVVKLVAML